MLDGLKQALRPIVPAVLREARWKLLKRARRKREELPLLIFQYRPRAGTTFAERRDLVRQMRRIHSGLICRHTHQEMVEVIGAILDMPASVPACIVEAGCFKGGSTAKLSLAAKLSGRKLYVFDSYEGLPEHDEDHGRNRAGNRKFPKGLYTGALEEVRENVRRFGHVESCEFVKGWFDQTMPGFREPVAVAYVDVDLASSTRTCMRYLYPLAVPGASIFSQDGHIPLCVEALDDGDFWRSEVGTAKPRMRGLRQRKLVEVFKPRATGDGVSVPRAAAQQR